MQDAAALFGFVRDGLRRGQQLALVTLTAVTGGASRDVGTQLAVREDGVSCGSLSGGCLEAAIIAEARAAIAAGQARVVRFGAGSRLIDIRLPCGGGIELLVSPRLSGEMIDRACCLLQQRSPVSLQLSPEGDVLAGPSSPGHRTGWAGTCFLVRHDPGLRLIVIGHGAEPGALLRLVRGFGAEAALISPDRRCVEDAGREGFAAELMRGTRRPDLLVADRHTAVILLFHDHDREIQLLAQVLEGDAFFVGAMGSRKTHAERCRRLRQAGVPRCAIARVIGPVGLIEAVRDPRTMGLSILAQVVESYQARLRDGSTGWSDRAGDREAEKLILEPHSTQHEVQARC